MTSPAGVSTRFGRSGQLLSSDDRRWDLEILELDNAVPRVIFELLWIEPFDVLTHDANGSAALSGLRVSDLGAIRYLQLIDA